jgi:hypothetical protein
MLAVRVTAEQRSEAIEGASCACVLDFGRLGSMRVALKMYRTRREALYAYTRQWEGVSHGLAPQTIGMGPDAIVEIVGGRGYRFGYLSEQARPYGGGRGPIESLRKRLRRRGLPHLDLRACNIGWVGRRLVRLDFDGMSVDR